MMNGLIALASSQPMVTPEMFDGLTEGITANLGVILPVGLGIFAAILIFGMIPRFIKKFTRG